MTLINLLIVLMTIPATSFAHDYSEALSKTKDALYESSPIPRIKKQFEEFGKKEAELHHVDKEVGVIGYLYLTYKNREIKINLGRGKKLNIKEDRIGVSFPI